MEKIKKHPILWSVIVTFLLGIAFGMVYLIELLLQPYSADFAYVQAGVVYSLTLSAFLIYPILLTLINITGMILKKPEDERLVRAGKRFEYITIFLGVCYSVLFMMVVKEIGSIVFTGDWYETLYNAQVHAPVWTHAYPTVITLFLLGAAGYLVLSWIPLNKMPPLVIVTSIAAMYLGIMECILWIVQVAFTDLSNITYLLLCLFPFNCIVIAVKTIRYKIAEWNAMEEHADSRYDDRPVLKYINDKLVRAQYWPLIAFILMWPLLGIMICILALFGQEPDSVIKAWTETADWKLSQQIAPPNVIVDEHYLCTVAAGGHEQIVKPIRMGERHGHRVVVNRQLCVANAFEQILEERTPRFHRHVRHFYDTCGFPVAKLIHSRYTADLVYFLMKPLEWIFLIVIYFCDVKPENRIAVQYLPERVVSG